MCQASCADEAGSGVADVLVAVTQATLHHASTAPTPWAGEQRFVLCSAIGPVECVVPFSLLYACALTVCVSDSVCVSLRCRYW